LTFSLLITLVITIAKRAIQITTPPILNMPHPVNQIQLQLVVGSWAKVRNFVALADRRQRMGGAAGLALVPFLSVPSNRFSSGIVEPVCEPQGFAEPSDGEFKWPRHHREH
jgi:hypothetical protein